MNTNIIMRARSPLLRTILNLAVAISLTAEDQILRGAETAADPFTRDGKPIPGSNEKVLSERSVLYSLIEYFEVPADAWLAYAASHPVHHDATALRAEVQRWVEAGKAKPIEITSIPCVSGNRAIVESILEHRYPIEFVPAEPRPVPTSFETRNSHLSLEWEPTADLKSRSIDSRCVATLVTYCGEVSLPQPKFVSLTQPASDVLAPNTPALHQVSTPWDADGKRRESVRLLCFFRAAAVPIQKQPKDIREPVVRYVENGKMVVIPSSKWEELITAAEGDPASRAKVDQIAEQLRQGTASFGSSKLSIEIQRMEVTIADLNQWYSGKPLESATAGLPGAAMEWIRAGRGRIIDVQAGAIRSGDRRAWQNAYESRFPSEYVVEGETPRVNVPGTIKPTTVAEQLQILAVDRPGKIEILKDPAVSPGSFETRNMGYLVEVEPVLGREAFTVDLVVMVSDTKLAGQVSYHEREVKGEKQTTVEQPMFATMKIATSLTVTLGHPTLLGINTPMEEDMKPSTQRRILTFVTVRD